MVVVMDKLWLKITGFVVLVGVAIIAVNVFRPGQTPIAESKTAGQIQKERKTSLKAQPKTPAYERRMVTLSPDSAATEKASESVTRPQEQDLERHNTADQEISFPYPRNSRTYMARQLRRKPSEWGQEQHDAADKEMSFQYPRDSQTYKARELLRKPTARGQEEYYPADWEMGFQYLGSSQTNKVVELLPPQWHQKQYYTAGQEMGIQHTNRLKTKKSVRWVEPGLPKASKTKIPEDRMEDMYQKAVSHITRQYQNKSQAERIRELLRGQYRKRHDVTDKEKSGSNKETDSSNKETDSSN